MNKKSMFLIAGIFIVALIIIFSFFWPPVSSDNAEGAFTKADKYRETAVQNTDIILRTELLKDSNKLKEAIIDLIKFGEFTHSQKIVIDDWYLPILQKYYQSSNIGEAIEDLKEFSDFIENNNQLVISTIANLTDIYVTNKQEISSDLESQVKQFYNYANQYLIRDSVYETTINRLDLSLNSNAIKGSDALLLRDVRDRLVIDNLLIALSVGDESKLTYSANQKINNIENIKKAQTKNYYPDNITKKLNDGFVYKLKFINSLNCISNTSYSNEKLNYIPLFFANDKLNLVANAFNILLFNQEKLNAALNQEKIGLFNQGKLNASANQEKMNAAMNQEKLGMLSQEKIALFTILNTEKLGLILDKGNLGLILYNQDVFKAFANANQLGLFNQDKIGIFAWGSIALPRND